MVTAGSLKALSLLPFYHTNALVGLDMTRMTMPATHRVPGEKKTSRNRDFYCANRMRMQPITADRRSVLRRPRGRTVPLPHVIPSSAVLAGQRSQSAVVGVFVAST
jgi:hypothetical protein